MNKSLSLLLLAVLLSAMGLVYYMNLKPEGHELSRLAAKEEPISSESPTALDAKGELPPTVNEEKAGRQSVSSDLDSPENSQETLPGQVPRPGSAPLQPMALELPRVPRQASSQKTPSSSEQARTAATTLDRKQVRSLGESGGLVSAERAQGEKKTVFPSSASQSRVLSVQGQKMKDSPRADSPASKPKTAISSEVRPGKTSVPVQTDDEGSILPDEGDLNAAQQKEGQKALKQEGLSAPADEQETAVAPFSVDEHSLSHTAAHSLQSISLSQDGREATFSIASRDTTFPCKSALLEGPDRLVLDFPGSWKGMRTPPVPPGALVHNVRLGVHPTGPRIVLDLSRSVRIERIRPDAHTLLIRLR